MFSASGSVAAWQFTVVKIHTFDEGRNSPGKLYSEIENVSKNIDFAMTLCCLRVDLGVYLFWLLDSSAFPSVSDPEVETVFFAEVDMGPQGPSGWCVCVCVCAF